MAKVKMLAKTVQFYTGTDLMAGRQSSTHKDAEIELIQYGAKIKSKKTKRIMLIPWTNIKGVELFAEVEADDGV